MNFRTEEAWGVTVISLEGDLMGGPDGATLNNKLHNLLADGKKQIVLDLGGVRFMNSSGLGLMLGGLSAVKNAGGTLKVANVTEKIASIIKISKLSPVFDSFDSTEDAIASFKQ